LKNRVIRSLMVPLCAILCILTPGTAFASVPEPSSVNTTTPAITSIEAYNLYKYSHGQLSAVITVEKGNTLSGLSENLYGTPYDWNMIFQMNRDVIQDPSLIYQGEILSLPNLPRQEIKPVIAAIARPVTNERPVYQQPASQSNVSVSDETTSSNELNGSWQSIVSSLLPGPQAGCLDWIIDHESGGNIHATNKYSGAYGIPQALPGNKMASAGPDWMNSAYTQIKWMIGYVDGSYGGACGAQSFWEAHSWY
jgi:LysM repeat protein